MYRLVCDILPSEIYAARVRPKVPGDQIEKSCFSRPIRTYEGPQFSFFKKKIDMVNSD
jgi:hypothetical protein